MSLDLYLQSKRCPHCEHYDYTASENYTYNCSPMWYAINPESERFVQIEGLTGKESLYVLNKTLSCLNAEPEKFIAMNPDNGWGSYKTFKEYIQRLITLAENYPDWIWSASR